MPNEIDQTSMAHPLAFDQSKAYGELGVETPEQVELRFPVAGIGSRFLAVLTDHVIQVATVLVILFVVGIASSGKTVAERHPTSAENWWIAGITFAFFVLFWGYFTLFEGLWNGQTPGKRLLKIRVIKDSGRSITFFEALARNLLRIVDYLPGMYLAGVITMLCNKSQKRLGDLVAATMVVHERVDEQPLLGHTSRSFTANIFTEERAVDAFGRAPQSRLRPMHRAMSADAEDGVPADAVARLKTDDLHLIETFFARALDLSVERRAELAVRVAATLSGRMGFVRPEGMEAERMLELVAHQMRGQGRF